MKRKIKLVLLFYLCLTSLTTIQFAYAQKDMYTYAKDIDTYAEVLIETNKKEIITGEEQNKKSKGLVKLPDLNGVWVLRKTTIERRIDPVLIKPVALTHCNKRLPFEKRDFIKEVVISSPKEDLYTVRALYPVTTDIYYDPNQEKDIAYDNFGFKADIDPKDLTYAYTIKLNDHIQNPSLSRQLWLNGRLKYENISRNKITARGYEIEYTPECQGFLLDEILLEFDKKHPIDIASGEIEPKNISVKEPEKSIFDSAKPREKFKPSKFYRPIDTTKLKKPKIIKVPGLW